MKKTLLSLVMLTALVAFGATQAEAANPEGVTVTVTMEKVLDITVDPDWAIGTVTAGTATVDSISGGTVAGSGDNFTVTNNSNASSTLTTTVGDSTDWTFAADPGADIFAMDQCTDGTAVTPTWTEITTLGTILATPAAGTDVSFDLMLYLPTSTTVGGTGQSIAVTITAS